MDFLAQSLMLLSLGYLSTVIEVFLIEEQKMSETGAGMFISVYTAVYFIASIVED
jgi:hypothetical protein